MGGHSEMRTLVWENAPPCGASFLTGQGGEEGDAEGPGVDLFVVARSRHDLGCHVSGRPTGLVAGGGESCEPEVSELDLRLLGSLYAHWRTRYKNILGFEVPMNYISVVTGLEGQRHLSERGWEGKGGM